MQRWILSRAHKEDINPDYGIYPDSGDVAMEAVNRKPSMNEYDHMYEDQVDEHKNRENDYDKMYEDQVDEHKNQDNEYDKMYDWMAMID